MAFNPLVCDHCGVELPTDDAVAIIEGLCAQCRSQRRIAGTIQRGTSAPAHHANETTVAAKSRVDRGPGDALAIHGGTRRSAQKFAPAGPVYDPLDDLERTLMALGPPRREVRAEQPVNVTFQPPAGASRRICPPEPPPPGSLPPPSPERASMRDEAKYLRRRRDLVGGILAGLLLTLSVAAYFVGTAGESKPIGLAAISEPRRLSLQVSPADALVFLAGEAVGPPNDAGRLILDVPAGDLHEMILEIAAAGYQPLRKRLSAFDGTPEASVELQPAPYSAIVTTDPPDAEIWLDGELRGNSPLALSIAPGDSGSLRISKTGFQSVTRALTPPANGEPLQLDVSLQRTGPVIAVATEPPGAAVKVDGRLLGDSPLEVALDPFFWGRTVEISASAAGFEAASIQTQLPVAPEDRIISASLVLERAVARVEIRTDPPGAIVRFAGEEVGPSPVTIELEPAESGRETLIEASLAGKYFGRQLVVLPARGASQEWTIPLAHCGQRVVFVSATFGDPAAHYALAEPRLEQIERLQADQRFAAIFPNKIGADVWPAATEMAAATSEQKIRAFDVVRSARPSSGGGLEPMLQATLAFQPTTVWLYSSAPLDATLLEDFAGSLQGRDVSVHVVQAHRDGSTDWLEEWTARLHGSLTVLGNLSNSTIALDQPQE